METKLTQEQAPLPTVCHSDRKLADKLEGLKVKYNATVTYANNLRAGLQIVADADVSNSVEDLSCHATKILEDNPDIT